MKHLIRKAGLCVLVGLISCSVTRAQDIAAYSNRKVFSGFVEYSNDSSHMLLGYADGRKITALGASFERRRFLGSNLTGSWLTRRGTFIIMIYSHIEGR